MKALLKQLAALMIQKESGSVEVKPEEPAEELEIPTDFEG
jgi:hypothetical protein